MAISEFKSIKISKELYDVLSKMPGKSFTTKIERIMNNAPNTGASQPAAAVTQSVVVDYNKITEVVQESLIGVVDYEYLKKSMKEAVEGALVDMKQGRL